MPELQVPPLNDEMQVLASVSGATSVGVPWHSTSLVEVPTYASWTIFVVTVTCVMFKSCVGQSLFLVVANYGYYHMQDHRARGARGKLGQPPRTPLLYARERGSLERRAWLSAPRAL